MWDDIPRENRKRFYLIGFLLLPAGCLFGLITSTVFAKYFNFDVDLEGIIFVSFVMALVYFFAFFGCTNHSKYLANGNEIFSIISDLTI